MLSPLRVVRMNPAVKRVQKQVTQLKKRIVDSVLSKGPKIGENYEFYTDEGTTEEFSYTKEGRVEVEHKQSAPPPPAFNGPMGFLRVGVYVRLP